MSVTITIPSSVERHLQAEWGDALERKAAEALAVEGYRSGVLSTGEVAAMLSLSVNDADGFLKERGLFVIDNLEELEVDAAALEDVLSR